VERSGKYRRPDRDREIAQKGRTANGKKQQPTPRLRRKSENFESGEDQKSKVTKNRNPLASSVKIRNTWPFSILNLGLRLLSWTRGDRERERGKRKRKIVAGTAREFVEFQSNCNFL